MAGQIVIVSGTSGSGKSTACERFARHAEGFWLLHGIDHFMAGSFPAAFGHHGPRAREGVYAHPLDPAEPEGTLRWSFGPEGERAFAALHEGIAAASRAGCNIVFDHLMLRDPPITQDIVWRLKDLPVLLVTLTCPYDVLLDRIAGRAMDKKLPTDLLGADAVRRIVERLDRLRPWFYQAAYANEVCDLEIDTVRHGPEAVVALIEDRLAAGPGTAFETLRARLEPPGW